MTTTKAALTHTSYAAAMADLKARKGAAGVALWDAGNGWLGEGYWCPKRRRVVQCGINPAGMRIW